MGHSLERGRGVEETDDDERDWPIHKRYVSQHLPTKLIIVRLINLLHHPLVKSVQIWWERGQLSQSIPFGCLLKVLAVRALVWMCTVFPGWPIVFGYQSRTFAASCPSHTLCGVAVALTSRMVSLNLLLFLYHARAVAGAKKLKISHRFFEGNNPSHITVGTRAVS